MIDSEGYVFCQKLTAEGMKRILAASQCIQKLSTNVLVWTKEISVKGLLTLNKVQHEPILGKLPNTDFVIRHAALGADLGSFLLSPDKIAALAAVMEGTSEIFEYFAKKDKELNGGRMVQKAISRAVQGIELGFLWLHNPPLAAIVSVAKIAAPALEKLDRFALEHGQDWRTKTGGVYVR